MTTSCMCTANAAKLREQAKALCAAAEPGAIMAVECWNQSESEHSFFLCELLTHPGHKAEDDLHRDAPSQAGKPKSTENGEQAQPIRKGDP